LICRACRSGFISAALRIRITRNKAWWRDAAKARTLQGKSFLVLFFKKELLLPSGSLYLTRSGK